MLPETSLIGTGMETGGTLLVIGIGMCTVGTLVSMGTGIDTGGILLAPGRDSTGKLIAGSVAEPTMVSQICFDDVDDVGIRTCIARRLHADFIANGGHTRRDRSLNCEDILGCLNQRRWDLCYYGLTLRYSCANQ
jgi:hypothetical protein